MHMRKSAILLAVLLTATPALAAEECLKLRNGGFKYGDTAHCFVRIDGQIIINRTCHIGISGDTRVWAMDGLAEAWMRTELPGRPFYGYFCRAKKCSM